MTKDDIRVRRYSNLPDGRDAEAGFQVGSSAVGNDIEVFYLDGSMASEVDARDKSPGVLAALAADPAHRSHRRPRRERDRGRPGLGLTGR